MTAAPSIEPVQPASPENAKRQQILDGARRCFLGRGFEAASMGEIARESKVSKGTLYVYFDSKETLFTALVEETKRSSAEQFMRLDTASDEDITATLVRCLTGLILNLTSSDHIAMVRMVIGASDKFPGIARSFFAWGPRHGARSMAHYLAEQDRRGRLRVPDPETAAWQLLGMSHHPVMSQVLLGGEPAPDEQRAREIAQTNVATFLAAYTR